MLTERYTQVMNELPKEAQFRDYGGPAATLYIFTPKIMPDQTLRSFNFNFTPGLVDAVTKYQCCADATAPRGAGKDPAICQAIMPSVQGMDMNMSDINTKYTFVLVIDGSPYPSIFRQAAPSPNQRTIAIGYFSEEPMNMATGSVNPNSVLIFTHTTQMFNQRSYGARGQQSTTTINHNVDIINPGMGNHYQQSLLIATPQDMVSAADISACEGYQNGSQMTMDLGDLMVDNVKANTPPPIIGTQLCSPKHYLNHIMQGIDAGVTTINTSKEVGIRSEIMPGRVECDLDVARESFRENLAGSHSVLPTYGFDTQRPHTMSELNFHFANLNVIPFRIPPSGSWDVTSQSTMSPRNVGSALISSCLHSFVQSCGLASFSFYYSSWNKNPNTVFDVKVLGKGEWQIFSADPLFEMDQATLMHAINTLKECLEDNVFNTLLTMRGHFTLGVLYNASGEVLIDLLFLDDRDGLQEGQAFYETSAKYGGLLNPMLCQYNDLASNAGQLHELADSLFGVKLGQDIFHQGTERYVNNVPNQQYNNTLNFGSTCYDTTQPVQPTVIPVNQSAPSFNVELN